jgi:hypothetical protein
MVANNSKVPSVLSLVCKRWDARSWEFQELVEFKVKAERETEKAVLLVDATSQRRRSTWMPKKSMDSRDGVLSPWVNSKLIEAGFGECDVFSIPSR